MLRFGLFTQTRAYAAKAASKASTAAAKGAKGAKGDAGVVISENSKKVRLVAATVLERYPVILEDVPEWKQRYVQMKERHDEHIRKQYPPEFLEQFKGKVVENKPDDNGVLTTFPLHLRVTEADRTNNFHSLNRALQHKLFLIVKKDRSEHAWQYPQGGVEAGETLRQAAMREFVEECGNDMKVFFLGHHPMAHIDYELSPKDQEEFKADATRVFFYRAIYQHGKVQLNTKELVDYNWRTKEEMREILSPELMKLSEVML
eukprot:TRINITY_DN548_c0_g5_i1.p1 TRINITY_DN548_c0_g5~~TRINITY_DN548_c0_g5_i1.p1  ORF type:complete len:260 (-),score=61.76 TRINITY_DN548_c0_g5_i1:509-1288(-)